MTPGLIPHNINNLKIDFISQRLYFPTLYFNAERTEGEIGLLAEVGDGLIGMVGAFAERHGGGQSEEVGRLGGLGRE
jgi:hypothetical protein